MGEIVILNEHGDVKVEWDPDDAASVKQAKDEFDRLKKDGYLFYEVAETRGKQVKRFTKNAGKLLAAPGAQSTADKKAGTRQRASAGGPVASAQTSR